jgi:hypothetical protein
LKKKQYLDTSHEILKSEDQDQECTPDSTIIVSSKNKLHNNKNLEHKASSTKQFDQAHPSTDLHLFKSQIEM